MTPPAGSAAAAAPGVHRGRTAVPTRPSVAPRKPRRISGPARPTTRPAPARRSAGPAERSGAERGLANGALAALNSVSRNPSLDRLIRGRTWIALIAFALIGIVTLQLLVLRLNANIGRALVREAQLQRANATLSIESSELAAGERVESLTAKLGMELVPEGALRFLSVDPRRDIARAAAALDKPVQTASTAVAAEATGTGASTAGAESESAGEASTGTGTSSVGSTASQTEEASTTPSETTAGTVSESPATSSTQSTATPPSSTEASATVTAGETGATEAAPGTSASGTQAGGAG